MRAILTRRAYMEDATFGELQIGNFRWVTVEQPWNQNTQNHSCIPKGTYLCKRIISPTKGMTFEVTNVPGRTHILFHVANVADELQGCIGLGMSYGYPRTKKHHPQWGVLSSGMAFEGFKGVLEKVDTFTLEIRQFIESAEGIELL